jgi:ATP-dependent helicase/nuclease subunit B
MPEQQDIRLNWLDWTGPALPQAVQWLVDRFQRNNELDLSNVVVVLPGTAAARRLTELLVVETARRNLLLIPPDSITVGNLPERLYKNSRRFATDTEQLLAWAMALHATSPDQLLPLFGETNRFGRWHDCLRVARSLIELHRELSSDVYTFRQVVKQVAKIPGFPEMKRWEALSSIQRRYFDILESSGLWDKQTARVVAVFNNECHTDKQIVLIGCVDLNQSTRRMLEQVGKNVDVLVVGDNNSSHKFDRVGCLIPDRWLDDKIAIEDSQISIAENPLQQASEVIDWLAGLDGKFAVNEIQIGLPDQQVKPFLIRALANHHIECNDLAGDSIAPTEPVMLLRAIGRYLKSCDWQSFADLIRHPDLFAYVSKNSADTTWIQRFDQFFLETLPAFFYINRTPLHIDRFQLGQVCQCLLQWLTPALNAPESLANCCQAIRQLLVEIYSLKRLNRKDDSDRKVLFAVNRIQSAILELETAAVGDSAQVSIADAILLIVDQCSQHSFVSHSNPDCLELAGWLELPLSDAAAICVTGMNDGTVPSVESTSMFLPNSLRMQLGLMNNDRRYARDAYAIQVILNARSHVHFVSGRRDNENSPQLPSRLLMACDRHALPERANRFFSYTSAKRSSIWISGNKTFQKSQSLEIPKPSVQWPIDRPFSVTDFKAYMQCPYRFYLSRVLALQSLDAHLSEFAPNQFGNLLHNIVEQFGRSDAKDSADANLIRDFLLDTLQTIKRNQIGDFGQVAIDIQLKQMTRRLVAFSIEQAKRRQQGWLIQSVESKEHRARIDVDDQTALIKGRIDRIDIHETDGRVAVLDYKAFEKHKEPEKTHRDKNGWIDLQLPLYYQLIASSEFGNLDVSKIGVGYFLLPGDTSKTGVKMADWNKVDLDDALDTACKLISDIRHQKFWPPALPGPTYDDFTYICQIGALESNSQQPQNS